MIVIAAVGAVKLFGIGRLEFLVFGGAVFGVALALLTLWWSVVHVIGFAALALVLGGLDIAPFSGEFGILPAMVVALLVGAPAVTAAVAVCLTRWYRAPRRGLTADEKRAF